MDMQTVDVFVDKNGEVRIEVRGVKGKTCLDVTEGLEKALGNRIEDREMTHEAHDTQDVRHQDRQRNRDGA